MKQVLLITLSFFIYFSAFSQLEKKHIRKGNKEYEKKEYQESEISYLKAIQKKQDSFDAAFNLGDALYKQEKYEEAANQFLSLVSKETAKENMAKLYHNLGNSFLHANKLEESIEAYKEALRNKPEDMETKYNLAFALDKLKKQQQNQQNQQNKQNQQDQQNKQNNQQQQQNKEQQQQQQQKEISKENAERILEALQNEEKEVQEKLKKEKAKAQKASTGKNW